MRLYEGSISKFVDDSTQNALPDIIKTAYESYYSRKVNPSEYNSWVNSLRVLKDAVQVSCSKENMVLIEYELPYVNNRIDCIIFGKGPKNDNNVVLIELKAWGAVEDSEIEGNVTTFTGGALRQVSHPSLQVIGYKDYLQDFVSLFHENNEINLFSCSYCHNYAKIPEKGLFSSKFNEVLSQAPVFTKTDFNDLSNYLRSKLNNSGGAELFNKFILSPIYPSRKLMEHANKVVKKQKLFTLIDDQIAAYNTIVDRAKKASKLQNKTVIIVNGGPGTGKSAIALNSLAELLSRDIVTYHATGSKAFTSTLRKIVGTRAEKLFKYFNSFQQSKTNEINVLIMDEAHRIRKSSNSRFTKADMRSTKPQIDELINAAKVSVFFIDDDQVVRPDEIGSTKLIKETAKTFGAEVYDFELKTQFRCNGSDGYLNWVDDILGIKDTANKVLTKEEKMDFKIFETPEELYSVIKARNAEKPNSARLVAGFCWPWSDPKPDGTLKEDVVIGNFKMTWEAKNEATNLAPGIPRAALWAYDPDGVNQVGSIYTIQGFEFDYVGVIIGNDIIYDLDKGILVGKPANSADKQVQRAKEDFLKYAKNAYRVLLTRGMKGCYVYFVDKQTELYFKSRIKMDTR